MNLKHFSYRPVPKVITKEQVPPSTGFYHKKKPEGLWLSDEDDYGWQEWCEMNDYGGGWRFVYKITLRSQHNVLIIRTEEELFTFSEMYEYEEQVDYYDREVIEGINWPMVAEMWDGIIITPFQAKHHCGTLKTNWYYGWDCASGCIWDANSVLMCERVG